MGFSQNEFEKLKKEQEQKAVAFEKYKKEYLGYCEERQNWDYPSLKIKESCCNSSCSDSSCSDDESSCSSSLSSSSSFSSTCFSASKPEFTKFRFCASRNIGNPFYSTLSQSTLLCRLKYWLMTIDYEKARTPTYQRWLFNHLRVQKRKDCGTRDLFELEITFFLDQFDQQKLIAFQSYYEEWQKSDDKDENYAVGITIKSEKVLFDEWASWLTVFEIE